MLHDTGVVLTPAEKDAIEAAIPEPGTDQYTVFREVVLDPGQQETIPPIAACCCA